MCSLSPTYIFLKPKTNAGSGGNCFQKPSCTRLHAGMPVFIVVKSISRLKNAILASPWDGHPKWSRKPTKYRAKNKMNTRSYLTAEQARQVPVRIL